MISSIEDFARRSHPNLIARFPRLAAAQVVLIPNGLFEAAMSASEDHVEAQALGEAPQIPITARPLSVPSIYYVETVPSADMAKIMMFTDAHDGQLHVSIWHDRRLQLLGEFKPGLGSFHANNEFPGAPDLVLLAAYLLAFCDATTFVEHVPAGDRSFRRQMTGKGKRQAGPPVLYRWRSKITPRATVDGAAAPRVPLHWRRGHWRKAKQHFRGAVDLSSDPLSKRRGWHTWIEGMWVGDPAFGIRRKIYAPPLVGNQEVDADD